MFQLFREVRIMKMLDHPNIGELMTNRIMLRTVGLITNKGCKHFKVFQIIEFVDNTDTRQS